MKRYIVILLLTMLTLSGCVERQSADSPEQSHLNGQPAVQEHSEPDFVALERGEVLMEQQLYPYEGYWKMLIIDYGSATKKPVCSKEGCAHDSPDCTAWHEDYGRSNCNYYRAGESIVGIQVSPRLDDSGLKPLDKANITVTDIDGQNHRTIYECMAGEYLGQGQPLYDGRYLYVVKLCQRETPANSESIEEYDKTLLKIDISDGRLADSFGLKNNELITPYYTPQQMVGTLAGKPLYLCESRKPCETQEQKLRFGISYPAEIVFFTLSLTDGSTREINRLENPSELYYDYSVWQNMNYGFFPAVRLDDLALLAVDIKTGAETVVMPKPNDWESYSVVIVDDHFVFDAVMTNKEEKRFASRFDGGDLAELTWTYYYNGGSRHSTVQFVSESGYYVDYDSRVDDLISLGPSGEPIETEAESIIYGMIEKNDFWSDTPNFKEVTGG